jgi:hypothetical protein
VKHSVKLIIGTVQLRVIRSDRLGDELHRVFMQHLDSRFVIQCESCGRFRGALPFGATLMASVTALPADSDAIAPRARAIRRWIAHYTVW